MQSDMILDLNSIECRDWKESIWLMYIPMSRLEYTQHKYRNNKKKDSCMVNNRDLRMKI